MTIGHVLFITIIILFSGDTTAGCMSHIEFSCMNIHDREVTYSMMMGESKQLECILFPVSVMELKLKVICGCLWPEMNEWA